MRIVSGKYGGFTFHPSKGIDARPTTDRAKEAIINMLNHGFDLNNKNGLDLFTGTGNMAYEFISNGLSKITCVDSNIHSINFVKTIFQTLNFNNYAAIKSEVFKYLSQKPITNYDIIFADPPYGINNLNSIVSLIFENQWLADDGILILEHQAKFSFGHVQKYLEKIYGQSKFSFFKHNTNH